MKVVYNKSGFNQARDALRATQRTVKYRSFTTGEKLHLLERFDALVEGEKVPQNVASSAIGVSLSCVLNWRSKKEALSVAATKDKLSLHKGPAKILHEVEQDLVEYIHLWHQKGFPVSRMSIVERLSS